MSRCFVLWLRHPAHPVRPRTAEIDRLPWSFTSRRAPSCPALHEVVMVLEAAPSPTGAAFVAADATTFGGLVQPDDLAACRFEGPALWPRLAQSCGLRALDATPAGLEQVTRLARSSLCQARVWVSNATAPATGCIDATLAAFVDDVARLQARADGAAREAGLTVVIVALFVGAAWAVSAFLMVPPRARRVAALRYDGLPWLSLARLGIGAPHVAPGPARSVGEPATVRRTQDRLAARAMELA